MTIDELKAAMLAAKTPADCKGVQDLLDVLLLDDVINAARHKALSDSNALRLRAMRAQDNELDELRAMEARLTAKAREGKGRVVADRLGSAAKRKDAVEGAAPASAGSRDPAG